MYVGPVPGGSSPNIPSQGFGNKLPGIQAAKDLNFAKLLHAQDIDKENLVPISFNREIPVPNMGHKGPGVIA